jgi:hypothetical protein
VRSVDLAIYADTLAARASALTAQLERARGRIRRAAIEREARRALGEDTVTRLETLGVLTAAGPRDERAEIAELAAELRALEELQAWVEGRLFEARDEDVSRCDSAAA